jgi:drug/metabolite transporter (DMT)-like permease
LYYQSVQYITASVAVVVLMQFTWMTVLLDWCFLKNKPSIRLLVTIPVILGGTVLASGGQELLHTISFKGLALAFGAALLYALYIVANSRIAKHIAPVTKSAMQVSGAAMSILVVNSGTLLTGIPATVAFFKWTGLLALFGTIIPPLLFAKGIPKVGASFSSVIMVAEMPMAILCAATVLDEPIEPIQYVGMLIMLGSIIYLTIQRR